MGLATAIGIMLMVSLPRVPGPDGAHRNGAPGGGPASSTDAGGPLSSSAPPTLHARDGKVAFWENRLAEGGGHASRLQLIDALIERARATGELADLGRATEAIDDVEALAPPADPGLLERRGRIAYALHDFAGAVEAAEEALEIDPGSRAALALLGDASLEIGDVAAADAAYAELAERGRGPAVLSRLARRAWLGGDVTGAEALVREAIEGALLVGSSDERAFYHYQLAEMLRWRDALDESAAAYRAALDLQADHAPSMGGLARVLEARGERGEAIRLLEDATARLPAPDLVATLGDLYSLDGRVEDAEDAWALVLRIADVAAAGGAVHDRQLALFLADHGRDPERAVSLARTEIEVRRDIHGWDALAWALHAAGRFDEADAAIGEALRLGTPDARIRYHAGLIALALGRRDEAGDHLAAAAAARAALPPLQVPRLDSALVELGR
jgi:tetratricopeptide (TPR) repeat protein